MVHIVFQQADIDVLQKAIALDASLMGEVIQIKDDYAVGPLGPVYETEGWQQRKAWWKEVLEYSPYTASLEMVDDRLTVHELLKYLSAPDREANRVWIWMGQNQHDVCGYYWLISQLKAFQGQLDVLYLNNLPFLNEKGNIFYPSNLYEIQPKEFLKAKRLARTITLSEFELDPDEWKKLCDENGTIRILEGGKKIVTKDASYYDQELTSIITTEPQKLNKILLNVYSKTKIRTGDVFLAWRIRQLIGEGKLVSEGDWTKGWKDVSIRVC